MGPLRFDGWLKVFNDYVMVLEMFLNKLLLSQGLFYLGSSNRSKAFPKTPHCWKRKGVIMAMFNWSFSATLIAATLILVIIVISFKKRSNDVRIYMRRGLELEDLESCPVPSSYQLSDVFSLGLPWFFFHKLRKLDWLFFNISYTFTLYLVNHLFDS